MKWTYRLAVALLMLSCSNDDQRFRIFEKENLMAWCIVPYDAEKRGPEERAQMLKELGITMLAYDWREEHIPTFDKEWEALKRHGITLQAFWLVSGADPERDCLVEAVFEFLERNGIQTQLWTYIVEGPEFGAMGDEQKVGAIAPAVAYIADRAKRINCQVGLYNHRGWFGEPENQLKIIAQLNRDNVGVVYNFHHGIHHHERFGDFFPLIEPHLMALNLAGIKKSDTSSFYGVGQGNAEYEMIRIVLESGYSGPVGIINHDRNRDAREGLIREINGLDVVLDSLRFADQSGR